MSALQIDTERATSAAGRVGDQVSAIAGAVGPLNQAAGLAGDFGPIGAAQVLLTEISEEASLLASVLLTSCAAGRDRRPQLAFSSGLPCQCARSAPIELG